jgi:hypothetical protein
VRPLLGFEPNAHVIQQDFDAEIFVLNLTAIPFTGVMKGYDEIREARPLPVPLGEGFLPAGRQG